MMATRTELGFPPKKKLATYGKASKRRSMGSGLSGYEESPLSKGLSPNTQVKSDKFGAAGPSESETRPRRYLPVDTAEEDPYATSNIGSERAVSRDAGRQPQAAPRSAMKRKPSQIQSGARQTKKQRSSSPDSSPMAQAPLKRAGGASKGPSSVPRTTPSARRPITPPRDTVMKDIGAAMPFSPGAVKNRDTLNITKRKSELAQQEIPFRPTSSMQTKSGSTMASAPAAKISSVATGAKRKANFPAPPRRRLIDALALQAEPSSAEEEEPASQPVVKEPRRSPFGDAFTALEQHSLSQDSPQRQAASIMTPRTAAAKKARVKFTYSQQRTMLAEDPMESLAGAGESLLMSQSLLPTSQSNLSAFSFDDEAEDHPTSSKVRSIHELRQAGANNRFADELDDILDRVGSPNPAKPSSIRRGALLELSQKLQERSYQRQFRDHSGEERVFRNLSRETDPIAGYILGCILIAILANSASSHLVQQLRTEGVSALLTVLLPIDLDIVTLAKERKNNVSKHAQSSLVGVKSATVRLPIWKSPQANPSRLSPRTVALKCMELIAGLTPAAPGGNDLISAAVTQQLFSILSEASGPDESDFWEFPDQPDALDLYLALALLEVQSVWVMQSDLSSQWTRLYLPTVADVLQTSLSHQGGRSGDLECLALKVTLNTANNNPDAQQVFVNKGLLNPLVTAVCDTFDLVRKSISDDDFLSTALDSLLLMLGVMINFSEHDASTCKTLVQQETAAPPLDRLIKIFLDYCSRTAEADSVEKSSMNVAFGYLSVLLGYLCLYEPIRERFGLLHPGGSLDPLLGSIREFIDHHKAADYATSARGEAASFTGRLQILVDELEIRF